MDLHTRSLRSIVRFALLAGLALGNSTQALGEAPPRCATASSSRSDGPFAHDGFTIVHSRKLYRIQRRPHARFPFGVELVLRTPAGTTAADVYRVLSRGSAARDERSPVAVDGARIQVRRVGSHYQVQITSQTRSKALEIQHRTAALTC